MVYGLCYLVLGLGFAMEVNLKLQRSSYSGLGPEGTPANLMHAQH